MTSLECKWIDILPQSPRDIKIRSLNFNFKLHFILVILNRSLCKTQRSVVLVSLAAFQSSAIQWLQWHWSPPISSKRSETESFVSIFSNLFIYNSNSFKSHLPILLVNSCEDIDQMWKRQVLESNKRRSWAWTKYTIWAVIRTNWLYLHVHMRMQILCSKVRMTKRF